eukprot:CAMPEP_0177779268 /NCGR_PEP_ID=MMETSP0491_2-20121128/16478_1 /TAXON_ID=63592 /ORGANISM="Tetraselmis chuii, Strain PLY429" /LENGTH=49 /DNA_ID= /DNA_START= /DNA_END= /DNA_ORIENTATION=
MDSDCPRSSIASMSGATGSIAVPQDATTHCASRNASRRMDESLLKLILS